MVFLASVWSKVGRKLPVRAFNCSDSGFLFITLVFVQLKARFCVTWCILYLLYASWYHTMNEAEQSVNCLSILSLEKYHVISGLNEVE